MKDQTIVSWSHNHIYSLCAIGAFLIFVLLNIHYKIYVNRKILRTEDEVMAFSFENRKILKSFAKFLHDYCNFCDSDLLNYWLTSCTFFIISNFLYGLITHEETALDSVPIVSFIAYFTLIITIFEAMRKVGIYEVIHHIFPISFNRYFLLNLVVVAIFFFLDYVLKPAILGVRLFANSMAGHLILDNLIEFRKIMPTVANGLIFVMSIIKVFSAVLQAIIFKSLVVNIYNKLTKHASVV